MTDLKFRAFLKKENKVVEVKSIHLYTKKIIYGYSAGGVDKNRSCSFEKCELMQYSHLYDKNNKRICEGDILKYYFDDYEERYEIRVVVYKNEVSMFVVNNKDGEYVTALSLYGQDEIEIIGNIYDNKDLLK